MTELPAKLSSLRKRQGLTQLELAEKLNVSRQAISRWEVGTAVPTTDNLKVLSNLYGVTVDYLLNDNTEDFVKNVGEPEREPFARKDTHDRSLRTSMIAASVMLAVLVAVIAFQHKNRERGRGTPIGKMTGVAVAEDYMAMESAAPERFTIRVSYTRATGAFAMSIPAKAIMRADSSFAVTAGDSVTIKASYAPFGASVDFGLVDSEGVFFCFQATNGSVDRTIQIEESGRYTLQVRNNSANAVQVSGFVSY